MTTKKWQELEVLVKHIESMIAPQCRVEHNLKLPVINSHAGHWRQCDVVIYNGIPPRQTISIVEVQLRKSKPSHNDFNGWVEKMKEVGAQHLICVSQAGFTKQTIEKAKSIGPSVRLIHFSRLTEFPKEILGFVPSVLSQKRVLKGVYNAVIDYESKTEETRDYVISIDESIVTYNSSKTNFKELIFSCLNYAETGSQAVIKDLNIVGILNLELPLPEDEMYVNIETELKKVTSFKCTVEFEYITENKECSVRGYKQIDYNNTLAWVMETTVSIGGEEQPFNIIIADEVYTPCEVGAQVTF